MNRKGAVLKPMGMQPMRNARYGEKRHAAHPQTAHSDMLGAAGRSLLKSLVNILPRRPGRDPEAAVFAASREAGAASGAPDQAP